MVLAKSLWDERLRGRADPSDLAQQALLEAIEKRDEFKGETDAEFARWLRAILAHNMADEIRALGRAKRDRRLERSIEAALEGSSARLRECLAADQSTPSERAAGAEQLDRLADSLTRLPSDQQEAVVLHHLRGLSLSDTARRMGKTVPAVAGLIRRGLKGLRESIGDQG